MKLDTTIKLGDILKIATAVVVVTAYIVTNSASINELRRGLNEDHQILLNLSTGFEELSKWQSATDVKLSVMQNDYESRYHAPLQSPHEKGEN